jgi:hypothetical protein
LSPAHFPLRTALMGLAAALLAACAAPAPPRPTSVAPADPAIAEEARKQAEMAVQQEANDFSRLQALFWPLNRAAAPLCPDRAIGSIGPLPGTLVNVKESSRPVLRRLLGIEERLTFTEVVDNTPAARAGILPGDLLLAVDGTALPVSADAAKLYVDALAKAAARNAPVVLQVSRKGAPMNFTVPVERVCAYAVSPAPVDSVTAMASGRRVFVTRGMLRFASDRELAIVLAHELAHIALGHTAAQPKAAAAPTPPPNNYELPGSRPNVFPDPADGARDTVEEARAKSQQRELDADTVGAYLVAAAGMPVRDAANLWRRIAANYPATIQHSHLRTHPASPERFVELERATRDVEQKRAARQPLTARMKSGRMTAPIAEVTPVGPWAVNWVRERFVSPLALETGAPTAAAPALITPPAGEPATSGTLASAATLPGNGMPPAASTATPSTVAPSTSAPTVPAPSAPSATSAAAIAPGAGTMTLAAATPAAPLPPAESVPYLNDQGRTGYRAFLTKVMPRAFALGDNGGWASAWGTADAGARALARCTERGGSNCRLFAVDAQYLWIDGNRQARSAADAGMR